MEKMKVLIPKNMDDNPSKIEEPWAPMVIGIYKKTKDSVSALSIFREALAVKQDVDENLCGDFFGWKIII